MTESEYPKRPGHFAHKFCRLLAKATIANELGADVCWMLTVIAHTEDAKGYRGPVLYFNGQLMSFCGFRSEDALARCRGRAVKAGWLHYVPGSRSVAGRYWVLVPGGHQGKDDLPSDERAEKYEAAEPEKKESQQPAGADVGAELGPPMCGSSRGDGAGNVRDSSSLHLNRNQNQDPQPPAVVIPPELDTEAFRTAWGEWKADRRERGIKPYTPRGESTALKQLAKFGPGVAVEAIQVSIRNQWQGLFPEKVKAPGGPSRSKPSDYATRTALDAILPSDEGGNRG